MTLEQFERQIKEGLAPLAGQEINGLKVLFLSSDIGGGVRSRVFARY